ncbi:beta-propeller fold lactonase family protein [Methylosinus sp. Ce-a6]|uniref:lactonase family protein n=1 Tax=Methylosinus sp. Ce-a6 TaxID=2172005 RepID=UPI00135C2616|nr:beta-propeller fold lactonase family protein [Methylosinus sp. Ce-a6]
MFDRRHLQLLSYASICALLQFFAPTLAHSRDRNGAAGAVYTMSNDTSSNALLTFERNATGELTAKSAIPTGGRGTGAGLGNQGALALSDDGRWLVVVNPGSDDITLFNLKTGRPEPTARAASGGTRPISVSIEDDLVYVLNAGSDSIAGFRLNDDHGRLEAVANSVRPLSGTGVGAAEIGISRGGRSVVVTEKATNKLTVYALDDEGRPARSPTSCPLLDRLRSASPFLDMGRCWWPKRPEELRVRARFLPIVLDRMER